MFIKTTDPESKGTDDPVILIISYSVKLFFNLDQLHFFYLFTNQRWSLTLA